MTRRPSALRTIYAVVSLAIGGMGATAAPLTKITAGTVTPGTQQWPEYVAQEFGWFKESGITFDLLVVGNGAAQQLSVGALDLAHSGFPNFVRAANQGAGIKIIINDIEVPPYSLFAKPKIKRIADLKGKVVSIGAIKDVTLIYVKAMLESAGLQPKDVDFSYAKAAGDRFRALVVGAADAAIINPPSTFRAATAGFSDLGEVEPYLGRFPFTVWATNEAWAAKNRSAIIAFIKSYSRAVTWLYDPAHKKEAVDILIKYAPEDRSDAEKSFDGLITRMHQFEVDGKLSKAAYKKMTQGLADIGDLTLPAPPESTFFDPSFVNQAAE